MNHEVLKEWNQLSAVTRRNVFGQTAAAIGLPAAAVEKDWWVVRTLELIFSSSAAPHLIFKGGTSLSKAWNLIQRFSEDIDLAINRGFLGVAAPTDELSPSQVAKLRRLSVQFIDCVFFPELQQRFTETGLEVELVPPSVKRTDQDPLTIEVYYSSLTETNPYLRPRVLIEIGSRSLMEPQQNRAISAFTDQHFLGRPFAFAPTHIPTVMPQRTFWEKVFLLHELFQLPPDKLEPRMERQTRHWYDLEKLMDTGFATSALQDVGLYRTIVNHRKVLNAIRGMDYTGHAPEKINLLPPAHLWSPWEQDYRLMRESMIHGPSLSFAELQARIQQLNATINAINYNISA